VKVLIAICVLNAILGASTTARDLKDVFHEIQSICSQFIIIEDAEPEILLHQFRDCCASGRYLRDCHTRGWGDVAR
jgi:hypothetical protein